MPLPLTFDRRYAGWHAAASLAVFVTAYLAAVAVFAALLHVVHAPYGQWAWLAGGATATLFTLRACEGGRWNLGLAAPPLLAIRDLAAGAAFAALLLLAADRLVVFTTAIHHAPGAGFPWRELVAVYLPAAIHEELVFRGYVYQKLRSFSRGGAIALTSVVFAAMHAANHGITPLALFNLLLAGVLLAFAYELHRRLWFPIGLHLAWNLLCGPVLGYDVSGYVPAGSVLTTAGTGSIWLTGGTFGIEASVWVVVVEVAGILVLLLNARRTTKGAAAS